MSKHEIFIIGVGEGSAMFFVPPLTYVTDSVKNLKLTSF